MKQKLMLLAAICCSLVAVAQPPVKLYGYAREVSPGNVPVGVRGNSARTEYLLFLQVPRQFAVQPRHAWIQGKLYGLAVKRSVAPVTTQKVFTRGGNKETVLVPATSQTVWQLVPVGSGNSVTPSAAVRKEIALNNLVVQYLYKGKMYTKTLKLLTNLEPLSLE